MTQADLNEVSIEKALAELRRQLDAADGTLKALRHGQDDSDAWRKQGAQHIAAALVKAAKATQDALVAARYLEGFLAGAGV